jgi:hypothetical protein
MKYLKQFEAFDSNQDVEIKNNFSEILNKLKSDTELQHKLKDFIDELPKELNLEDELEYNESLSWSSIKEKAKKLFSISPEIREKISNFLQTLGLFTVAGGSLGSEVAPLVGQQTDNQWYDKVYQALLNSDFGISYVEKYGHLDKTEAGVHLMLAGMAVSIAAGLGMYLLGSKIDPYK